MLSRIHKILGFLWASPCTAVGLMFGAGILLCGGSAQIIGGVLEVALRPTPYISRLPFSAITFGHVILGTDPQVLSRVRAHELIHVQQYERWGVFFFLAYPASSLVQLLRGKDPYWHNHFEVQARERSSGQG